MAEIEYTFKDGSKHIIPDTNQPNFERMFDREISSQRFVGEEKPMVYTPKAAPAAKATTEKEIIPFSLEEAKAVEVPAKEEVVTAPAADEVIIFEEN